MTGYLGAKKSLDHQSDLTLARYAMHTPKVFYILGQTYQNIF